MQSETTRIAMLAHRDSAYERRLFAGATKIACPGNGFIVRDFLVDEQDLLPEKLLSWKPSGAICCLGNDRRSVLQQLRELGCQIVDTKPNDLADVGVVLPDSFSHFDAIHDHFASLGRTDLVMFTLDGRMDGRKESHLPVESCNIYRNYAETRGLSCRCIDLKDDLKHLNDPARMVVVPKSVAKHLKSLNTRTGIFTHRRRLGAYLCRACELLEIKVPGDVAVVGTDGFDDALRSSPTLTTAELPAMEIGEEAARLLISMHAGKPIPGDPVRVPISRMFVRESTVPRKSDRYDIPAAVQFIEDRACDGISVASVILHTQGVSRDTFEKRFLETTGMRPAEAIRQRKLREARRLLADTSLSVTKIAEMCGFCDDIYFRKVFKTSGNSTPSAYRRMHQASH